MCLNFPSLKALKLPAIPLDPGDVCNTKDICSANEERVQIEGASLLRPNCSKKNSLLRLRI
jgi:hypothetical protein